LLVETTATPRPPNTRGISPALLYTLSPGVETRLTPLMTRFAVDVFHVDRQRLGRTAVLVDRKPEM
jgi:hypothetical protein